MYCTCILLTHVKPSVAGLQVVRLSLDSSPQSSSSSSAAPVRLEAGEVEVEELLDDGENDWSAAAHHMMSRDESSGVYQCKFCVYARRTVASVEKHVFAQHAKCHALTCAYCTHGAQEVNT